ncbi:MAG: ABC transporter ATP-binding protein/permease [Deltaproteobacteria bacterium]|nr:ABC transporter ATP-binding protein/permease [Deltaproteobacteria bacterium]
MATAPDKPGGLRQYLGVFRYSGRAIGLVWGTSRHLTIWLVILSLIAGLLPASMAYVGKLIVDAVVAAFKSGLEEDIYTAFTWVAVEAGLVVVMSLAQRGIAICQSLLRALLGFQTNVLILEKALTLSLRQFEDSEFYDKMTRARRQASTRPLSLVTRTFGLAQNAISLITYGALLLSFSYIAVAVLIIAALPSFFAEAKFSGEAFKLFRWRTPEAREQNYLETVIAREDYAKEVKLLGLGDILIGRYRGIFNKLYKEDRHLVIRRESWGFGLGLISTAAFYGAYAWIVYATARGQITLGDMTMYLMVFKQGQSALSGSLSSINKMYEDNLYLSNLYEFLDEDTEDIPGAADSGPKPGDGVRFENVSFSYPGATRKAVENVTFHLKPGEKLALVGENGSGKTTLIKLLTRLYEPSEGRVTLDGRDLREWSVEALRQRIGVIFQDFVRYQLKVGENIGVGDTSAIADRDRWQHAAELGMAAPVIDELPQKYDTQLGRWFKDGQELSLGQWQKIALSRAFIREGADLLILDEPTASMDAEAEVQIFDHFRDVTEEQMAIVISHRFSTVRMADRIVVLDRGKVVEEGSHEQLMAEKGRYERLFSLQAAGYQ